MHAALAPSCCSLAEIHKESTLVQWAKVDVVDVERDKVVYDRLLSFRGDDAYAWRRAEEFLVKDLVDQI